MEQEIKSFENDDSSVECVHNSLLDCAKPTEDTNADKIEKSPVLSNHPEKNPAHQYTLFPISDNSPLRLSTNLKEQSTNLKEQPRERSHQCSVCNKAFIDSSHLNDHMRIHTGERPYTCSVCDKAFNSSSNI